MADMEEYQPPPREPVTVKADRMLAAVCGIFAILVCVWSWWPLGSIGCEVPRQGKCLIGKLIFVPFTWFWFFSLMRLALWRPIMLYMDEKGISGRHYPTLEWAEVLEVTTEKRSIFPSFVAIRISDSGLARQWFGRRYNLRLSFKTSGFHVLNSQFFFKGTNAEEVVAQAQAFHAAALQCKKQE